MHCVNIGEEVDLLWFCLADDATEGLYSVTIRTLHLWQKLKHADVTITSPRTSVPSWQVLKSALWLLK